ncbi:N-acetylmuramoyl-L-alanine amidase [Aggregicoccus sp. 17bor-14]|uniref:golvesin C-terminal-like domain-containing protein n=1 Tax=Myxococcaceae TaxID=31 RepID=UPI00129C1102|nr:MULTISPECIES: N-acetylmuramoyl-L-alanine amidase [Myxococcaceae]MBF5045444.1 N-acetylmuramoyl-L-alanine amidase [Simulacricoccus sp. 17bor-14]MRI91184.1 N-acetylmuramoyl-L-alanine amidase [Aggregicoccus sp. 17bor-14]
MNLSRSTLAAAAAAALALAACGDPEDSAPAEDTATPTAVNPEAGRTPQALDPLFESAAAEYNVPSELLKAIGYAETRWEMVRGEVEFEGRPAAFGILALRGEQLEKGAALAGVSVEAAKTDALSHLRAGAALLSAYADELGVDRADLGAWAPAAVRLSGIENEEARSEYVHNEVYRALRDGAMATTPAGEVAVSLLPREVQAKYERSVRAMTAGPDYAASIWRPSPNYNSRPAGDIGDPAFIVIHTCEGSYSSCWSWLVNSASQVSAHYVVNESGSEISQLVREANRAWHVGASYDCSLNSSVECWRNGYSVNHFAVGIEHGGYASQTSFPAGQIDASAKLSCDISKGQAIPRDRYHIVGHGKLQPASRTDPGPNWPWTDYLNRINSYCGSTTSTSFVVDSNNANNDSAKARIEVSGNWTSTSSTAGYYGSGYYYASTAAISDPATFWFYLPAAGTKTIDAWWTAGTNRAAAAPFIIYNAAGTKLATVSKDQRVNGSQWNALGTWSFSAGWNKVQLSRWTTDGSVVIADAVRIR